MPRFSEFKINKDKSKTITMHVKAELSKEFIVSVICYYCQTENKLPADKTELMRFMVEKLHDLGLHSFNRLVDSKKYPEPILNMAKEMFDDKFPEYEPLNKKEESVNV